MEKATPKEKQRDPTRIGLSALPAVLKPSHMQRTPGREHPTHLSLSTADKNIDSINFVDLKFCFFVVLPG